MSTYRKVKNEDGLYKCKTCLATGELSYIKGQFCHNPIIKITSRVSADVEKEQVGIFKERKTAWAKEWKRKEPKKAA